MAVYNAFGDALMRASAAKKERTQKQKQSGADSGKKGKNPTAETDTELNLTTKKGKSTDTFTPATASGDDLYKQRQAQVEQANNDFKSNLFNMFGMGLAAQDAAGMPEQTELARYQRDYGLAAQEANQRSKELNKANDWEGRDELITRYREAQALAAEEPSKANMGRADELRRELERKDIAAGNGARAYTGQDRFSNVFQGALGGTIGDLANTAGTLGEAVGQGEMQRETGSVEQARLDNRFNDDTRKAADAAMRSAEATEGWQKIREYADKVSGTAAEDLQKAKEGLSSLGQAGVDISTNMIQMGFDAATGALTGGNSLVPMFLRTFGGSAREARQDGATLGEQVLYGGTKAAIEVGTEKLADGVAGIYGKGAADDITEELIRKLSDSDTGRTMLRWLFGAVGEGGEEVLSDLLSPVAELIYKDPSMIKVDPSEVLYDFLIGAAVGALGGGTSIATGQNAQANAELRARDAQAQLNAAEAAQSPVQTQENTQTQAAVPEAAAPAESPAGIPAAAPEGTRLTPLAQTILGSVESGWYGDAAETAQQAEAPAQEGTTTAPTTDLGRQSQTAETVRTSPVTDEATAEAIAEAEEAGGFNYLPISNDATMEDANQALQRDGLEHTLAEWEREVTRGKTSAKMVATGYLLFNEAQRQGNTQLAIEVLSDLQSMNTSAAQALQLNRMFQSLNPATRFSVIQRQIDKLSDKYSRQLPDGIKVSEEAQAAYLQAQDDAARDEALNNIMDEVAKQLPSTLKDKITAIRYLNMLGNFKTQGRNLIGNTLMSATTFAKNAVKFLAERASRAAGAKTELTTSAVVNRALLNEAKADYAENADSINGESKYSDSAERGFAREAESRKQVFKSKILEGYRKATNWAMERGDTAFIGRRYARSLAGYLQANGMDAQTFAGIRNGTIEATKEQQTLVDRARNYAAKEAQEATFHDSNKLADWVSTLGRTDNTPKAIRMLAEGIVPFRKTPANVLLRAEEYSPLGILNTAWKMVQESKGEATASDVLNQFSKALTGTGLFALGMWLRNAGRLTGHEDEEEQAAFNSLRGQQEYALVFPDGSSFTLDWAAPAAMPLFMGAQMMDILADEDISWDSIGDVLTSLGDPMLEMSMLQGVNDMLDNIKYSDNSLSSIATNAALSYLSQIMTNSLAGQIERTFEDKRYSTFANAGSRFGKSVERSIGKASAKTPGLDYAQAEYVDAWGRTQDSGNALTRALTNFFSPGYTSTDRSTEVDDELQRLYDNGMNNVFPDKIPQSYQVTTYNAKGEATGKMPLSADEYVQFQKTMGQTSLEMVSELMDSSLYRTMSDDARAKAISEIYSYARETAAREVEPNTPADNTKAGTLSNPAAYLGAKAALSVAQKTEDYNRLDRLMMRYGELPEDVRDALAKDSTVKHLAEAYDAGVSSKTYLETEAAVKGLKPAEGYTNAPTWQKVETVMNNGDLSDKDKDFFASTYFTHGENGKMSTYEKYMACREQYTPEQVATFYKIYSTAKGDDKNGDGKTDTGTKKRNLLTAAMNAGFTQAQANELYNMWQEGKWK